MRNWISKDNFNQDLEKVHFALHQKLHNGDNSFCIKDYAKIAIERVQEGEDIKLYFDQIHLQEYVQQKIICSLIYYLLNGTELNLTQDLELSLNQKTNCNYLLLKSIDKYYTEKQGADLTNSYIKLANDKVFMNGSIMSEKYQQLLNSKTFEDVGSEQLDEKQSLNIKSNYNKILSVYDSHKYLNKLNCGIKPQILSSLRHNIVESYFNIELTEYIASIIRNISTENESFKSELIRILALISDLDEVQSRKNYVDYFLICYLKESIAFPKAQELISRLKFDILPIIVEYTDELILASVSQINPFTIIYPNESLYINLIDIIKSSLNDIYLSSVNYPKSMKKFCSNYEKEDYLNILYRTVRMNKGPTHLIGSTYFETINCYDPSISLQKIIQELIHEYNENTAWVINIDSISWSQEICNQLVFNIIFHDQEKLSLNELVAWMCRKEMDAFCYNYDPTSDTVNEFDFIYADFYKKYFNNSRHTYEDEDKDDTGSTSTPFKQLRNNFYNFFNNTILKYFTIGYFEQFKKGAWYEIPFSLAVICIFLFNERHSQIQKSLLKKQVNEIEYVEYNVYIDNLIKFLSDNIEDPLLRKLHIRYLEKLLGIEIIKYTASKLYSLKLSTMKSNKELKEVISDLSEVFKVIDMSTRHKLIDDYFSMHVCEGAISNIQHWNFISKVQYINNQFSDYLIHYTNRVLKQSEGYQLLERLKENIDANSIENARYNLEYGKDFDNNSFQLALREFAKIYW